MSGAAEQGKHCKQKPAELSILERIKQWWTGDHALPTVILAAIILIALVALFWFAVFSDFGGSADFVYNQF